MQEKRIVEFIRKVKARAELAGVDTFELTGNLCFIMSYILPTVKGGRPVQLPGIGVYFSRGDNLIFAPESELTQAGVIHKAVFDELMKMWSEEDGSGN